MATPVFPLAAGHPNHDGIMIPEIWSAKLLYKLYLATVFAEISNTDYEGEITDYGNTVHVRTTPDIIINDYVKGQKLDWQDPEPSLVDLLIDKGKTYSFKDDKVDQAQSDYSYADDWGEAAVIEMRIAIDKGILGDVYADVDASNAGATAGVESASYNLGVSGAPKVVTKDNVVEYIQDMGSVLDEANVPEEDRWVVLPVWMCNKLSKSDLKDASLSGDTVSIARNGRIGMVDRFTLFRSNQLAKTTDGADTVTNAIFGHKCALTFASQVVLNEGPLTHADYFGRFYRGLNVYGYKVIKGDAMGHAYCTPG